MSVNEWWRSGEPLPPPTQLLQLHACACIELGLRWLHDRSRRCAVCRLTFEQAHRKRFLSRYEPRSVYGDRDEDICYNCLEDAAMTHGVGLE